MTDNTPFVIRTARAPAPAGGYSQGVVAGSLIFTAGQGPLNPDSGELVGSDIREQTAATLKNIESVLREAGASLGDVVKATVHLADLAEFGEFDKTFRSFFPADRLPARTTVQSGLPGIKVEIDVIAVHPDRR